MEIGGSRIFLSPGPTKVHPETLDWIRQGEAAGALSRSHRSPWFTGLFEETTSRLRELMEIPESHAIAFTTSSNEIWERSIQSLTRTTSYHVSVGEFGDRWAAFSRRLGRHTKVFRLGTDYAGDFSEIVVPPDAELVCLVQNETSTGFFLEEKNLEAIRERAGDALVAVDVVSGVPVTKLNYSKFDLAFFSVQKGFNLPAGLGVAIIGPRAVARCEELCLDGIESSGYHSISQLAASAKRSETAETPNVLGIYLLNCACKKLLNMGVNAIRSDAAERMNALICGIEAQTPLTPLVTNPLHRSPTMAAFIGPEGAPDAIKRLALDHGIFVGGCYNDLKPVGFRVANFPMNTHQEHQALIIRFQEIYG